MKKILAALLALTLALSMAACGDDTKTPADDTTTGAPDTTEPAETEPAEVPAMTYDEYVAAELESEVIIEAYVQAKQSWWDNKATIYAQDEDGAYFIYEMECSEQDYNKLVPGTKIRVTGYKTEWSGEVEIASGATFEIIKGETFIAEPVDLTDKLGTDELIDYQNQLALFKDMTVEAVEFKNGTPGDDIYVTFGKDGASYNFCVEFYLTGTETEVYQTVSALEVGEVVDVIGFLYWYEDVNTHITGIVQYDAAMTVDGAPVEVKTTVRDSANKYLEVSGRKINTEGIRLNHTSLPEGVYTLEFDLRSSVGLEEVADIDFSTNDAGDIFRVRESFGDKRTQFADFEKGKWTTISYEFNADGAASYSIDIYGGVSQIQAMPFDIDNIVIKNANGDVIYTENFDALEVVDFGGALSISGTTTDGQNISIGPRSACQAAIVTDDTYNTYKVADNSVVTYTGEALAAGNYIAKGYIRNGYFNANGSQKETADAALNSTDYLSWFAADTPITVNGVETTATAGLIGLNKNEFALKVTAGEATAEYNIISRWTAFEIPVTVAEGEAPVITFEVDHDLPYMIDGEEVVVIDIKNLEFVAQ